MTAPTSEPEPFDLGSYTLLTKRGRKKAAEFAPLLVPGVAEALGPEAVLSSLVTSAGTPGRSSSLRRRAIPVSETVVLPPPTPHGFALSKPRVQVKTVRGVRVVSWKPRTELTVGEGVLLTLVGAIAFEAWNLSAQGYNPQPLNPGTWMPDLGLRWRKGLPPA